AAVVIKQETSMLSGARASDRRRQTQRTPASKPGSDRCPTPVWCAAGVGRVSDPSLLGGGGGAGRLLRVRLDVVEVQDGVEQQVELAELLPPVTRVSREDDHASFSGRR